VRTKGFSRKEPAMATLTKSDYSIVLKKAKDAGELAAMAVVPEPMVVFDAHLGGAPIAGGKTYYVSSGACGFGIIRIKPANSGFAKWLKAQGIAYPDSYHGGLVFHAHPECVRGTINAQSVEINGAYAYAFAKVLRDYGISAYAETRLD
jgi:hypothetical protein